jgi:drug/metabolite transporter superfamily protein YnfA
MLLMEEYSLFHQSYGGMIIDKKKPDRFEIIGSLVAICGAIIIFYTPR